jgi:hypothetical protein
MTPAELKSLCASVNAGMSPRWRRSFDVSYVRHKLGLCDAAKDFTRREKLYVRFGIGREWLNADYRRRLEEQYETAGEPAEREV